MHVCDNSAGLPSRSTQVHGPRGGVLRVDPCRADLEAITSRPVPLPSSRAEQERVVTQAAWPCFVLFSPVFVFNCCDGGQLISSPPPPPPPTLYLQPTQLCRSVFGRPSPSKH